MDTSASLLVRVKAHDGAAWRQLVYLYSPMIYRWTRRAGLQPSDAQDVVQNVFLAVASDIERFRRDRPSDSFRGWLWTICRHKVLDHFREEEQQARAAGGSTAHQRWQQVAVAEPEGQEARDETTRMRQRAMALLRGQFEPPVWEAFVRTVVHGDRPQDVANDLGVSVATVYRTKFRVLTQLRRELEDM